MPWSIRTGNFDKMVINDKEIEALVSLGQADQVSIEGYFMI